MKRSPLSSITIFGLLLLAALVQRSSLHWSRVLVLTVIFACVGARAEAQTSFVFEAEYCTTKSSLDAGANNWTLSTTEAGYSGPGYMEGLPNDSDNCSSTPPIACGATMDYDFTVTVPGNYYVHFLQSSAGTSDNSLHWGIDGTWLEAINPTTVGGWLWDTGGVQTGSLTAGTHTLRVWMREDGTKIDKIVIDLSATPPVDAPVVEDFSVAVTNGNAFNISVAMPPGTVEGDLLVAIMSTDGGGETLGAPSVDWTPITGNVGTNHTSRSWYKFAEASEAGPYTFGVGSSEEIVIGILRISGADPSDPIDVSSTPNTATSASPLALAENTTVADTLILRYFGADDDDITQDSGYPSSHTGVYVRGATGGGAGQTSSGVAYTTQAPIGWTDTATFTNALTASEEWSAVTIAIKGPATALYRSVGTDSSDLNAAGPTVTITNNTATFASAVADTIGVGDAITYDDGSAHLAFIHGRTDDRTFTVQDKDGNAPAPASSLAAEVRRAYTSLGNWETQTQNPGITEPTTGDVNPPQDLTANGLILHVAAYADGADTDSTEVKIDTGWVTGPGTYIRIYTPVSTSEVGVSQRHTGIASTGTTGYVRRPILSSAGHTELLEISANYVRLEGLEFDGSGITGAENFREIYITGGSSAADIRIEQCIIHDLTNQNTSTTFARFVVGIESDGSQQLIKVANTIVYGIHNLNDLSTGSRFGNGMRFQNAGDIYLYNNIVFDVTSPDSTSSGHGIKVGTTADFYLKNNYVGNLACTSCTYGAVAFRDATTGVVTADYNVSYDSSSQDWGVLNNTVPHTNVCTVRGNGRSAMQ